MKPDKATWSEKRQALIVGLREPKRRIETVETIRSMGSAGLEFLPPLIKALEDSTALGAALLARTPAESGLDNLVASPYPRGPEHLIEAEFRRAVIVALGEIGAGTQKAIRVLITALHDPDAMVRTAAAGALGRMGLAASVAVPAMIQLLGDSKHFVREIAARALARIDPADSRIIRPLTDALKDSTPGVRASAAEALGNIRPNEETAAMLAGVLLDQSPAVRIAAAKSLAKFGLAARVAVPALQKAMETRYDSVRQVVLATLDRIGA